MGKLMASEEQGFQGLTEPCESASHKLKNRLSKFCLAWYALVQALRMQAKGKHKLSDVDSS